MSLQQLLHNFKHISLFFLKSCIGLVDLRRIHAHILYKNPVVHAFWAVVFWEAKCEYVYMHVCLWSFTECWECKGSEAETLPRVLSGRQLHAAERTGKRGGGHPWTCSTWETYFSFVYITSLAVISADILRLSVYLGIITTNLNLQVKMRGLPTCPLEARYVLFEPAVNFKGILLLQFAILLNYCCISKRDGFNALFACVPFFTPFSLDFFLVT